MFWFIPLAGAAAALFLSGCGDESEERPVPTIPDASLPPPEPDGGGSDAGPPSSPQFFIERVNVGMGGVQANGASGSPSISANGRFVAFVSSASNLVAGDTNNFNDVFVRDRLNGITQRVSVRTGGMQGNGHSGSPSISADGRFVAFQSDATNLLTSSDTNNVSDIFIHDRETGTTEKVSLGIEFAQGNGASGSPSISSDGRFVAFESEASNFVTADSNNFRDIFVRDRESNMTERISIGPTGQQPDSACSTPSISENGRFVTFSTYAPNLLNPSSGCRGVFVRDRISGITESVCYLGGADDRQDVFPFISNDGNFVTFDSYGNSLTQGAVFLFNRADALAQNISITPIGVTGNGLSGSSSVSGDGRFVAFYSRASDLISGDTNGKWDTFVRDRFGVTQRVSIAENGIEANDGSASVGSRPSISRDGRFLAFESWASNLVPGDTNSTSDIFVVGLDYFFGR